jgi:hypothetical protein
MANLAAFVKTGKLNDLFVKRGFTADPVGWALSFAIEPENKQIIDQQIEIIKNKMFSDPRNYSSKTTTMLLTAFIELIPHVYYAYYPIEKCMTAQKDNTKEHCWTLSHLPADYNYILLKLIFQNLVRFTTSSIPLEVLNVGFTFFLNRNLELVVGSSVRFIQQKIKELCDLFTGFPIDYGNYLIGICAVIAFCALIYMNKEQPKKQLKKKTAGLSIIKGVKTEQELDDLDEQYEKFKIFCTETLGLPEKLALEWNEQFYNFYKPCAELTKTLFDGIILMQ